MTSSIPTLDQLVTCQTPTCPNAGNPELPYLTSCPACHGPTVRYVDTLTEPVPAIVCPTWCTTNHRMGWEVDGDGTPMTEHGNADLAFTLRTALGDDAHVDVSASQYGADAPVSVPLVGIEANAYMSPDEARQLAAAVLAAAEWVETNA